MGAKRQAALNVAADKASRACLEHTGSVRQPWVSLFVVYLSYTMLSQLSSSTVGTPIEASLVVNPSSLLASLRML